jgi:acetoin utilization protein AcuB
MGMSTPSSHRVAAWMRTDVHVASPHDRIDRARALCERNRVNLLPVVDDGKLVGIVTDRDLRDAFPSLIEEITKPAAAHRVTAGVRVEDIMTRNALTVTEEDGIEHAAAIMRRQRIGALPVVRGPRLVGIVTRSDLLGALVAFMQNDAGSAQVAG